MEHDRSIAHDTTTPVMLLIADCAPAITSDNIRVINMSVLEFWLECIQRNPKQYIAAILQMMLNYLNAPLCMSGDMAYEHARWAVCVSWQTLLCAFLKIGHLYLLCLVEGITPLCLYIRSKKRDWMHLGLAVFLTMMVVYTFVGTYVDYSRSLIHTAPLAVLSLSVLSSRIGPRPVPKE